VVELEHDWVRLAAIPALLRAKVGEHVVLQSPPAQSLCRRRLPAVNLSALPEIRAEA
jgi:hypothetical protein